MKAWKSHLSSAFIWHSSTNTLSLWACWRAQAVVAQCTLTFLMALVAWPSFRWAASSAFRCSSLWQRSLVALFAGNCSGPHSFSPVAEVASLTVWLGQPWGEHTHAHCLQYFKHGWLEQEVSNMSEAGGATWCGHPWRHLCNGCHWGRDGWVHPLWSEGLSCIYSWWQSPQGCQWQLSPQCTALGDRGWGCSGSLLQPFQGPLEL